MEKNKLVSVTCPKNLNTSEIDYLTPNKTYSVLEDRGDVFNIIDDDGDKIICGKSNNLSFRCAHLNGLKWILNYE